MSSGTFDVQNITVSSVDIGAVCFKVHYIQGFTTKQSFVKLSCPATQSSANKTIGETDCILSLPHCSYTLSATDVDAVDSIDTMPAVSIQGIVVTNHECPYSDSTYTSTVTKTITMMPTTTGILRGKYTEIIIVRAMVDK